MADMEMGNLIFGHSYGEYCIEPREAYQDIFCKFLDSCGFDFYGEHYENDMFIMRPYYWGEDEDQMALPNFVYKPTGFEIRWYKYPMRDAYCNQDIDINTFRDMIYNCISSMNG